MSPRRDRVFDDPMERWAMPIGRIAGTRVSVSYAVFFAAAIVLAVVLIVTAQPGNGDLPRAASIGIAFWVSGWIVQLLSQFLLTRVLGLRLNHVSVGLLGVEAAPRCWAASRTFFVALGTITSLVALGYVFRWFEGGLGMATIVPASEMWTTPSLGFKTTDSIWRTGAWLCWVQAVFQLYPLPRSMGRLVVGSMSGILGSRWDVSRQAIFFRVSLAAIAALTLVLAIVIMMRDDQILSARLPLLVLGILLWTSSRSNDITQILTGFQATHPELIPDDGERNSAADRAGINVVGRIRQAIETRRGRARLAAALTQERSEAVDAQRVDEILNRLHQDGIDSLDAEDRKILDRVSANLRKERQEDS